MNEPLHVSVHFESGVGPLMKEFVLEKRAVGYKIHIPQFVRDILDLPAWHPVQDDLFMCNATRIVGRVHRRAGKTVGSRVKVVHRCMFTDTTVLVVAPSRPAGATARGAEEHQERALQQQPRDHFLHPQQLGG